MIREEFVQEIVWEATCYGATPREVGRWIDATEEEIQAAVARISGEPEVVEQPESEVVEQYLFNDPAAEEQYFQQQVKPALADTIRRFNAIFG